MPHAPTDGSGNTSRLSLTLRHPLRIELAQPPAVLRRLAQPLDEVGQLRGTAKELERVLELLARRRAGVEVVVNRDDGRGAYGIKLPLLLAGEGDRVHRVGVSAVDGLLRPEE